MNLREYLKTLDSSIKVKIGSTHGSSFFYVGNVGDLLENMKGYEDTDLAYYDKRVKKATEKFTDAMREDVSYSGYIKQQYSRWKQNGAEINFSLDGYNLFLKRHSERTQKKFSNISKEKENLMRRIPLFERTVVECFTATKSVEPDHVIGILVNGIETGVFWTTTEAKQPKMSFISYTDEEGD